MADNVSSLVRGTVVVFFGMFLGAGAEFLTSVLMARYLLPTNYGSIVIGVSILQLIALVSLFGLPGGITRALSIKSNDQKLLSGSITLVVTVSFLGSILGLVFTPFISGLFSESVNENLIYVFVLGVPFLTFVRITISAFRAMNNPYAKLLIQNVTLQGGQFAIVFGSIFVGFDAMGVAIGWTIPLLLSAILSAWMISQSSELQISFPNELSDMVGVYSLVKFSFPLLMSGTIWMMLQKVDNLLIGYFLPSSNVGIYDAAFTFSQVFLLIPAAFGFMLLPALSRAYDQENHSKMNNVYQYFTKWMVFIGLPVFGLLVFFPREVIVLTFGPQYSNGATSLLIISFGIFMHVLFGHNGNGLIAIGQSSQVFYGSLVALVSNIGLNVILIPRIGIIGAAVSSMIAYTTINLLWSYQLFINCEVQPFSKSLLLPATISFVLFIPASQIVGSLQSYPVIVTSGAIVFLGIHTVSMVVLGGIESDDRDIISRSVLLLRQKI